MSRDPKDFIHPELIPVFVEECGKIGHEVIITCVGRNSKEHAALWAQSRMTLPTVNRLRQLANLPPITAEENLKCVTWTKMSKHLMQPSRAFDFAIVYDGKAIWDIKADVDKDKVPDYLECAIIGEKLGLVSGRHFKKPDYPHLEWPD